MWLYLIFYVNILIFLSCRECEVQTTLLAGSHMAADIGRRQDFGVTVAASSSASCRYEVALYRNLPDYALGGFRERPRCEMPGCCFSDSFLGRKNFEIQRYLRVPYKPTIINDYPEHLALDHLKTFDVCSGCVCFPQQLPVDDNTQVLGVFLSTGCRDRKSLFRLAVFFFWSETMNRSFLH